MSDSYAYGDPTPDPGRASDGSQVAVKTDRQGVLAVSDRVRTAAMAGKLFVANFGSVTTPLSTPDAAIAARRPMTWLRIPSGKVVYIVRHTVTIEATGDTRQGEVALATSSNDVGDGTAADATALKNANPSRIASTPGTTGRQLSSNDCDVEADYSEFDRESFPLSSVNLKFEWNANELGVLLPLVGDASFLCYIGGKVVTFFAQTIFIEENAALAN